MAQLTHYCDLKAIPQLEMTQTEVVSHLMQSLHLLLPAFDGRVGVGFPAYGLQKTLGGIIRLFGSEQDLGQLVSQMQQKANFADYAIITREQKIEQDKIKGYSCFSRARSKGQSALRRAEKRLTAQGKWSETVKQNMVNKWLKGTLRLPHVHLKSLSTGQVFILWVNQTNRSRPVEGKFNAYGLSQTATVPMI